MSNDEHDVYEEDVDVDALAEETPEEQLALARAQHSRPPTYRYAVTIQKRVMIEAESEDQAREYAQRRGDVVRVQDVPVRNGLGFGDALGALKEFGGRIRLPFVTQWMLLDETRRRLQNEDGVEVRVLEMHPEILGSQHWEWESNNEPYTVESWWQS